MLYTVRILPLDCSFQAAGEDSLLEAALAAGIDLARSCRNGSCRACMCRLLDGRIDYRVAWPGLSAEEKQDGWVLPCVARAQSDLVLVAPGARQSVASGAR